MDDFDTLVSRIEHVDLPVGARELHLKRIGQSLDHHHQSGRSAGRADVHVAVRRRGTTQAATLVGAAVITIVTGACLLFTPARPPAATAPMASPVSSAHAPTAQPTSPAVGLFTAPRVAAQFAALLHISPAAAVDGLGRLATLAHQAGGSLDPAGPQFHAIAADLGVASDALAKALTDIKASAAIDDPASIAKPRGTADVKPLTTKTSGPAGADLTSSGTVKELAQLLHVSTTAAHKGLTDLATLAHQTGGGLDPNTTRFRDIATELGTTPTALDAALVDVKKAGIANDPAGNPKTASTAAGSSSADSGALMDKAAATRLAATLHVTPVAAQRAVTRLQTLAKDEDGLDPSSTAFHDIANTLGRSPAALIQALRQIKTGG